ncbi:MAG TPA: DMT family transporter [Anaerolineales bacterium]|nr:DMT family transporter [Anaerolineales bacterium]
MLSIFYGIASAAAWGAADFIGGLASKRISPYRVLFLAEIASVLPFLVLALFTAETLPPPVDLLWGALASLLGLGGLIFLYRALASGRMTIVAPVSALFAALLPVVFAFFTEGPPPVTTLIGFILAFLSVWLISQTGGIDLRFSISDLRLPLISGLFFGLYFIVLHRATVNAFFWPLVSSRSAGLIALGSFALLTRQPALPPRDLWGSVILNGILDIGGNWFYVLAARAGRLDVAAVLGSLYPASTVLLAWIFLKERISSIQIIGILLAFAASILFTV